MKKKALTASLEDYLETIYHIIEDKQAARVKEIAKRLEVNNSSVTGALKTLSKKGLLNYAPYDVITLTDTGEEIALDVIRRHRVLKKFITNILCIEGETADDAACMMEHSVTPEVLERIVRFVEFTEVCPRSGKEWISGFRRFCDSNFSLEQCQDNAERCMGDLKEMPVTCNRANQTPTPLSSVPEGAKARLVSYGKKTVQGKRFTELGITPGSLFEIEGIASETGDINVEVRGYHLTVRKVDAKKVMVVQFEG
ncbi:MAG: metal-dependent transcriptional regulator [Desulfobacterium sp.]|nr:metal-dependent transcriptional regulator [Desulfobacterium sp.]